TPAALVAGLADPAAPPVAALLEGFLRVDGNGRGFAGLQVLEDETVMLAGPHGERGRGLILAQLQRHLGVQQQSTFAIPQAAAGGFRLAVAGMVTIVE